MTSLRLKIGEWTADPATNELTRAGKSSRIEPKAMEVLLVLVEHAGEVVSRDQLLAAVWPGVVVGDEALTQSVIKLRKALGDNSRAPEYIETISKRGYRLIAPLKKAETAATVARGNDTETGSPFRRTIARRASVFALVAAVASGAASLYFLLPSPPGPGGDDGIDVEKSEIVAVTVLPFESLGAGAEHGYLARGISSDLATDLSRLSGLRVVSPAADTTKNARYVVSGSVQREGAQLRINVRLTDTRNDEQLWAQRFERSFNSLFVVQDEIRRGLLEQLPGKIDDAERRQHAKRYTTSPAAYEQFLRGQALFLVRQEDENEQARSYYAKALNLDPQFARAYAGLAMTYAMDYRYQGIGSSDARLARALELAESARLIDPTIPEVHWAIGFIHAQSRRYPAALQSLQKAIELNRSYADAYAFMGGIYTYIGEAGRSIPLLRTAFRLNPDGGYLYFLLLGRAYLFENDIEQALINLYEARQRNPADLEANVYLVAALVASGDLSSAEWEANELHMRQGDFSIRRWFETYPLTDARYQKRLLELADKLRL